MNEPRVLRTAVRTRSGESRKITIKSESDGLQAAQTVLTSR